MLYGGAAGGGKTDALLMHGYRVCSRSPGARVVLLRRTFADLSKGGSAIDRSHELFAGLARWNGGAHRWTFPNGSAFEFGHLQHAHAVTNYQGAQYDALLWDELTQFEEDQYAFVTSRVRSRTGLRPSIRAATNPGGVGHGWVKRTFVDAAPPETRFALRDEDGDEVASARFIPAKVTDNRALLDADPAYERRLRRLPEALRRALLEGDWDVFSGQVFVSWRRERHVLPPFSVPPEWPRRTGMDWGTRNPFVCLWLAWGSRLPTDPTPLGPCDARHVYVYREVAKAGWRDDQMASEVARLSVGERIAQHLVDPNSFFLKSSQTGHDPARIFAERGIILVPSNNHRIDGKRAVEMALADCRCGVPRLRAFAPCIELIASIPSLPYDEKNSEDVDPDADNDDPYDALRYALMGPRPSSQRSDAVAITGMNG